MDKETRNLVLKALYLEYKKEFPDLDSVKAEKLGISEKEFSIAAEMLQKEGDLEGVQIPRAFGNSHPKPIFSDARFTSKGITSAQGLEMEFWS